MRTRPAIIGCSKTKKQNTCAAHDMYQGTLFKKSHMYCTLVPHIDDIFIISAKYGIIKPEKIIKPYDLFLKNISKNELDKWIDKVSKQIKKYKIKNPLFLTATAYSAPFSGENLFTGMGLGVRLSFLKNEIDRLKYPGFNFE